MSTEYQQKGYLNSDFKIFHLSDSNMKEFELHYHPFHKILIMLKGNVTYHIDGKTYKLEPYDIVLIHAGELHRPEVEEQSEYERIIIYISDEFIKSYQTEEYQLDNCFSKVKETKSSVLRLKSLSTSRLFRTIQDLEEACKEQEMYASSLYQQALFVTFMIELNRAVRNDKMAYIVNQAPNSKISQVMEYICDNLQQDLTIESIAKAVFIDKYYLMHLFKEEAGCTVGNFITAKRLQYADEQMRRGKSITESCFECGFQNYSTFSRAYKKYFGCSPKDKKSQNISVSYTLD